MNNRRYNLKQLNSGMEVQWVALPPHISSVSDLIIRTLSCSHCARLGVLRVTINCP